MTAENLAQQMDAYEYDLHKMQANIEPFGDERLELHLAWVAHKIAHKFARIICAAYKINTDLTDLSFHSFLLPLNLPERQLQLPKEPAQQPAQQTEEEITQSFKTLAMIYGWKKLDTE